MYKVKNWFDDIRELYNVRNIKEERSFFTIVAGDICHYNNIKGKLYSTKYFVIIFKAVKKFLYR
jgi:hypothetical protein